MLILLQLGNQGREVLVPRQGAALIWSQMTSRKSPVCCTVPAFSLTTSFPVIVLGWSRGKMVVSVQHASPPIGWFPKTMGVYCV